MFRVVTLCSGLATSVNTTMRQKLWTNMLWTKYLISETVVMAVMNYTLVMVMMLVVVLDGGGGDDRYVGDDDNYRVWMDDDRNDSCHGNNGGDVDDKVDVIRIFSLINHFCFL